MIFLNTWLNCCLSGILGWIITLLHCSVNYNFYHTIPTSEPFPILLSAANLLKLLIFQNSGLDNHWQTLFISHILPVRGITIPQIIIRFYSPIHRGILFQVRKRFMIEIGQEKKEDLTKLNYQCTRKLNAEPVINNAWSQQGKIMYTTILD